MAIEFEFLNDYRMVLCFQTILVSTASSDARVLVNNGHAHGQLVDVATNEHPLLHLELRELESRLVRREADPFPFIFFTCSDCFRISII